MSLHSADLTADDHEAHVAYLRQEVDEALGALVPVTEPERLYAPVRYVLAGKGKRLRPAFLLLSAALFDVPSERAMPAALAVEVFHNFTLVHDDIMDHAAERRGRPTVHTRWDTDTAILCGDFMMGLAYELLAGVEPTILPQAMTVFSRMVTRLCEGQTLDKAFESQDHVSVADYLHMIDCKTGALLEAVLELGGILGLASDEQRKQLRLVGHHVGRAFQIQDDLLDLTAQDARWGKKVGGDLVEGKKTFLLLRALECAPGSEKAWFSQIIENGGLPSELVPEAERKMEALGVLDEAHTEVVRHTEHALSALASFGGGKAQNTLSWLINRMGARLY